MKERRYLEGFHFIQLLQQNEKITIVRALRKLDQFQCILKLPTLDDPTLNDLNQLEYEYALLKKLNTPGIWKPLFLDRIGSSTVLGFRDFEGILLSEYLEKSVISMDNFFKISINLVQIVKELHHDGFVHGNVTPFNILINPEKKIVQLINFHSSFKNNQAQTITRFVEDMEINFFYIAPEQTGRIKNRPDSRSDLYSLGATFYRMLTGKHLFNSQDPMEIIYAHLAYIPLAPDKLNRDIPPTLANLVMKLIAKLPKERYQSATGLLRDLEKSFRMYSATGTVQDFSLAQSEIYECFEISQKLYGRKEDFKTICNAFQKIFQENLEIIMVSGSPGIGKSFLIEQFSKFAIQNQGHFISGKFDQYKNNVPYHAIRQALQKMINKILIEHSGAFSEWKKSIQNALGHNGCIITDLLPELELIVGKQPDVPKLGHLESRNRFHLTFSNFIRALASSSHPLVMFIDDCQWADFASLELIKTILTDPEIKFLMFIGAYRDQEFNANSHCLATLGAIKNETPHHMQFIALQPLLIESMDELLKETLHETSFQLAHLSKLIMKKSQGNPLFAMQFLQSLYHRHILQFNHSAQSWSLDWSSAHETSFSEDTADIIVSRLNDLSSDTRDVLQTAASIGNIFDLHTLSQATQINEMQLLSHLDHAVENQFIVFFESFLHDNRLSSSDHPTNLHFKFPHDHIQQAAYILIAEQDREKKHLKIGQLLRKKAREVNLEENLFDIIYHYGQGLRWLTDSTERLELACLYLRAGHKARNSSAYQLSFDQLKIGLQLLPRESWSSHYDLSLALHIELAEAAYVCGYFDFVNRLFTIVTRNTSTMLDKIKIYEILVRTHISQHKLEEAIRTGLLALELLGIKFPVKPKKWHILFYFLKTYLIFLFKKPERILESAPMTDPQQLAAMQIVSALGSAIYWADPNLLPLFVFFNIQSVVKHGNCPEASYSYAGYGLILCRLGQIDTGHRFGLLAQKLASNDDREINHLRAEFVFLTYIHHYKNHIKPSVEALNTLFKKCLTAGDIEFGAWSLMMSSIYFRGAGNPLETVKAKMEGNLDIIKTLKQETAYHLLSLSYQCVLNILGETQDPFELTGPAFDEETMLPLFINAGNKNFIANYYMEKMYLGLLFERYDRLLDIADRTRAYINTISGTLGYSYFYFYDSLIKLAFYEKLSKKQKHQFLVQIEQNQKKLKFWMRHAPMNHMHKYYLVQAEKYRILKADFAALKSYHQAIHYAEGSGYIYDAALANELAARFYISRKLLKIASAYLMDAHYLYNRWGAKAKTKQLETQYHQIFQNINSFQKNFTNKTTAVQSKNIQTMDPIGDRIDFHALLKASHAIADEIMIDKLLSKLIRILMENAGAEKVVLMLKRGDRFFLEAEGLSGEGSTMVLQGLSIQQMNSIPKSIIHYVSRKREILVLNDASNDEPFSEDPYIEDRKIKSVLCMPLIYQNELTAICYMENNLSPGVFTTERREALRILASQAAISLKNALILRDFNYELEARKKTQKELDQYKDQLTQLVEERTNELIRANKELEREILEKSRMETHIKASLKEKELLLQEIHHRVKNNMQIISSLLNLQSRYTKDDKTLAMFKDSRDRIQSMALIHEILYKSDDLTRINLEKYARNLASGLYQSYGTDPKKIRLEIMIEKVFLSIDLAIPCGLIINELVSNALKYAFPAAARDSGIIRIVLQTCNPNEVELIVEDNGIGLQTHPNTRPGNTLGLKLVSILVEEQLHGTLMVKDHPGTVFSIRFPFKPALSFN
ncbi:MAG: GAF domain-containing protein [Desulfobacteraceae bacterium]|nr:MAG: GAF domain-containing protein [Desulfobacteraceae bacterium]